MPAHHDGHAERGGSVGAIAQREGDARARDGRARLVRDGAHPRHIARSVRGVAGRDDRGGPRRGGQWHERAGEQVVDWLAGVGRGGTRAARHQGRSAGVPVHARRRPVGIRDDEDQIVRREREAARDQGGSRRVFDLRRAIRLAKAPSELLGDRRALPLEGHLSIRVCPEPQRGQEEAAEAHGDGRTDRRGDEDLEQGVAALTLHSSVPEVDRRQRHGTRLPDDRPDGHGDQSWHVSAPVQVGAPRDGGAAQEAGKPGYVPLGLGNGAGEAHRSQLLDPLLRQEERDTLAAFGGDPRHSEAEHQRKTDQRDRQNDAGREDFEKRDPALVGETQRPGIVGNGMGRWGAAVVALLTIVTFLPALRNKFVGNFDDAKNFLTNPHYRGLGWTQIEWMFTTMYLGQYVPVTWITLGLDYLLWGMNAAGYPLTSLLLHAVTAVLFYFVSRHLIGLATGRPDASATAAGAAVAALLFAVHPVRVESVVWVTERRDVVSGVFYMLTLLAWFRAVEREPRSPRWYWASVALFACALLSKALTVALPIVLLVLDVYPLRRLGGVQGWRTPGARRVYAEKAPFVVLAAVAAVIALVAIVRLGNMAPLDRLSLSERVGGAAFSLTFYLWKTPLPGGLPPPYELPARVDLSALRSLQSFAVIGLTSALGVLLRRRAPWLTGAWIVYVVTLLPVVGILQNGPQIAADRYTYLGCLPWALLVGGGAALALTRAWARGHEAALALAVAAVLLGVALEALSVNQTGAWRDELTPWRHAARVAPSNASAYNNLRAPTLAAAAGGRQ